MGLNGTIASLSNADLYESTGGRKNFSESLVTIEVKPSMLEVFQIASSQLDLKQQEELIRDLWLLQI